MRVNTNTDALDTWRGLARADLAMNKSLEKLASGLRINRSGDDAAGLGVSEALRGQVRGLQMAERNTQEAIGYLNIVDGTGQNVHDMLQRMRELAIQSANGTLRSTDRTNLTREFNQLRSEIARELRATRYKNAAMFSNTAVTFQVGANGGGVNQMAITIGTLTTTTLGINGSAINNATNATTAIGALDGAIAAMSSRRATWGAFMNRLEHTLNGTQVTRENLTAAESRIRDADMATEVVSLTRQQILTRSGTAMLAQANAQPANVMNLING